jgi:hypothetical protein
VLRGLALATQDLQDMYGPIPEWLEGATPLSPPGSEVSFLKTSGANPFAGMFEDWTSMLSPPVKTALQKALGHDLFTGDEFTDPNVYTPFGSDQPIDLRTLQPVDAPTPGWIESLLQNVPQYNMAKDALGGGASYDTANIFDVASGEGVIRDETGAPQFPTSVMEQFAKFMGLGTVDIDLEGYQEGLTEAQQAALLEAIRRQSALEAAS